jgi:hypothetical protein
VAPIPKAPAVVVGDGGVVAVDHIGVAEGEALVAGTVLPVPNAPLFVPVTLLLKPTATLLARPTPICASNPHEFLTPWPRLLYSPAKPGHDDDWKVNRSEGWY